MSEINTHNVHSQSGDTKRQRTRLFSVLRIIDNRLQALAPSDPEDRDSEPEWTDLGAETLMWEDREEAFQTGRAHGGLLVSADGIPGGHRVVAYHTKVRAVRLAAGDTVARSTVAAEPEAPAAPLFPNAPDRTAKPAKGKGKETEAEGKAQDDIPF